MSQQEMKDGWKLVTDHIDQEIMNMIAEKSKNVSIEEAREALQKLEAWEREHEAEEAANKDDE